MHFKLLGITFVWGWVLILNSVPTKDSWIQLPKWMLLIDSDEIINDPIQLGISLSQLELLIQNILIR